MLELLGGRNKARIAKVVRLYMVSIFLVSVTSPLLHRLSVCAVVLAPCLCRFHYVHSGSLFPRDDEAVGAQMPGAKPRRDAQQCVGELALDAHKFLPLCKIHILENC